MRILYIFPHPDDESFGPARAMAAQRRQGDDVYLLTLTRGEATKVRHKFGWTLEQMGEARYRELSNVKTTLDLNDIRILNLPDGGLQELDPWTIEKSIRDEVLRIEPHVIVTFPIHGISGFPDHVVTHFAVTRVYLELQGPEHPWLQRLAFFTVVSAPAEFPWHVNVTAPAQIDCAFQVKDSDMDLFHKSLDCYVTYADVIARTRVHQVFDRNVHFELFREDQKPPFEDLSEGLGTSLIAPPGREEPASGRETRAAKAPDAVRRVHWHPLEFAQIDQISGGIWETAGDAGRGYRRIYRDGERRPF